MLLILVSLLIFGAVSAAAVAIHQTSAAEKNPVALRLRELRAMHTGPTTFGRRPPLLAKLIAQLGGFMPARDGTDALRPGLVRAGYRRQDAVLLFLGSKVALAVALPILWGGIAYATARPLPNTVAMLLFVGFVGFYLPTLF